MGALLLAFLVEVGIITYRDLAGTPAQKQGHTIVGLPLPSEYLAAVLVFGALGMAGGASQGARTTSSLIGWGLVTATLLNLGVPGIPASQKPTASTTSVPSATSTRGALI
jgi:hypothetical protein